MCVKTRKLHLWSLLAPLLLAVAACGGDDVSRQARAAGEEGVGMASIEGEVFYRERMLLPPGAELEVQLQDISRADALATVMASVLMQLEGGPPYAFAIDYDPANIDSRLRYALRATISLEERLLFTTTDYIDPFGDGPLQVLVRRVAEPVDKAPQTEAEPEPPPAPVADTPPADAADTPTWVLKTLGDRPAPPGADGNPADLVLDPADNTAAGFSGCNRYSGSFRSSGSSSHGTPIKFGPLASTMRACADGGDLEQAYLKMLAEVDAYRMQGSTLALLQGDKVVATFELR